MCRFCAGPRPSRLSSDPAGRPPGTPLNIYGWSPIKFLQKFFRLPKGVALRPGALLALASGPGGLRASEEVRGDSRRPAAVTCTVADNPGETHAREPDRGFWIPGVDVLPGQPPRVPRLCRCSSLFHFRVLRPRGTEPSTETHINEKHSFTCDTPGVTPKAPPQFIRMVADQFFTKMESAPCPGEQPKQWLHFAHRLVVVAISIGHL